MSKKGRRNTVTTDETSQAVRELWTEEGDEFFGNNAQGGTTASTEVADEDDVAPVPKSKGTRGKKRQAAGAGRGRGKGKRKHAGDSLPDDL